MKPYDPMDDDILIIHQLEMEVARLKRYEDLVRSFVNDYFELSHDKVRNEYVRHKTSCRNLIQEDVIAGDAEPEALPDMDF